MTPGLPFLKLVDSLSQRQIDYNTVADVDEHGTIIQPRPLDLEDGELWTPPALDVWRNGPTHSPGPLLATALMVLVEDRTLAQLLGKSRWSELPKYILSVGGIGGVKNDGLLAKKGTKRPREEKPRPASGQQASSPEVPDDQMVSNPIQMPGWNISPAAHAPPSSYQMGEWYGFRDLEIDTPSPFPSTNLGNLQEPASSQYYLGSNGMSYPY